MKELYEFNSGFKMEFDWQSADQTIDWVLV
jgi:hypothetical protein